MANRQNPSRTLRLPRKTGLRTIEMCIRDSQEALYNQYINGACKEFKLVANMTDGYLAVAEGKADVCICSTASAQLYADANGGMSIPDYRFKVDPNMNGTCVAMPMEGTESLAELVNQCIACLLYTSRCV